MNKGRKKRIAAAAVVLALAGGTATYFLTRKTEQTQQGPTVQVERGDLCPRIFKSTNALNELRVN
jgi:hypothetical protein